MFLKNDLGAVEAILFYFDADLDNSGDVYR